MDGSRYKYESIEEPSSVREKSRRVSFLHSFTSSVILIICVATLASMVTYTTIRTWDSIKSSSKPIKLGCGNSTAEARSLGCTFDPLSFTWLPAECPRDGTDEFLHSQIGGEPWRYWVNGEEGRTEMSDYEALSEIGGESYYTTTGEHVTHCAYVLLRAISVMRRGDRVDMISRNVQHTKHCVGYLLEAAQKVPDYDNVTTGGGVYFGYC